MVKKDVRIEFFGNGKSLGECVRIGGEIVKTTIESLDKELAFHLSNCIAMGGIRAWWRGVEYFWTTEELTPERAFELALEIQTERKIAALAKASDEEVQSI
jgi:hypothetical protein